MHWLREHYRIAVRQAILHRYWTVGIAACLFLVALYLTVGGPIGSEFLPHLDEGSIWVRGTLPPSEGPSPSIDFTNQARRVMASFPEVTRVVSQTGRPDDGTDTTGFFNTEYFVDLKRKEEWRPVFHQDKEKLIAAMNQELEKFPGSDLELLAAHLGQHGGSGFWGQGRARGEALRRRSAHAGKKAEEIQAQMATVRGIADLGIFRIIGQPNLNYKVDREAAARWGINVGDIQDAIQTAVGANVLTQVQHGEARFDVTLRYEKPYRDTREAIDDVRLLSSSGERVSLAQLTKVTTDDGAEEIYREAGQRYIAIKYSVRGRDLGSTVGEAIQKVDRNVQLPAGYHLEWAGEYESQKRARQAHGGGHPDYRDGHLSDPLHHVPLDEVGAAGAVSVMMASIGGPFALFLTHTNFSVSSAVGFLALFGVSVQTGVIMLEYINQLRARRKGMEESSEQHIVEAAVEGAVLRLRPIMMTMLVATLGLLPAALSHAIGSDSQRPFAIVIVGGLLANLVIGVFLLPTFYVWVARADDILPASESAEDL